MVDNQEIILCVGDQLCTVDLGVFWQPFSVKMFHILRQLLKLNWFVC